MSCHVMSFCSGQPQYGAPPQQQYGAPPPQQQYGAPPQQQYGAPGFAQNPVGPPPPGQAVPGAAPRGNSPYFLPPAVFVHQAVRTLLEQKLRRIIQINK